jgi:hypothetical protein
MPVVPPASPAAAARRRGARLLAGLLTVLVIAAGCGTTTVSPTTPASPTATGPTPTVSATPGPSLSAADLAALYARIEAQVQQLRGLTARDAVTPKVLDEAALMAALRTSFEEDNPAPQLAAEERLLKALGLLPPDASLRDLFLHLLDSQVAGFYKPDEKQLFVVSRSGGLGPAEQVAFAHEFTHALQDQAFGLKKLGIDVADQGDASLARLSLAEGDATLLMSDWASANLDAAGILQLFAASNDPKATAVLAAMPPLLKDELLFPYTSGLRFVLGLRAAGGWPSVDAAYARPPASTEQILHPEKYAAAETPIALAYPADLATRLGPGWTVDLQDTLGEFQLREWLQVVGKLGPAAATTAAAGWGGDRVALVSKGATFGVVIETAWDTPADAVEFSAAAKTGLAGLPSRTAQIDSGGTAKVTLFIATDDATIAILAGVLGLAG